MRIAGEMIWATRFEEEVRDESARGRQGRVERDDGQAATRYFANFAIGLCEGPIARIGRVWADGKPFDLANVTYRLHRGDETQEPDSLIEAKQGNDARPPIAARPISSSSGCRSENSAIACRIFSFEVIRPVGRLEEMIRAVTMIPGATEFGYSPTKVRQIHGPGHREPLNDHTDRAATDWRVAVDELVDLCPNLESVGLVVAWFGNDLRANHCTIKPGVVSRNIVDRARPMESGRTRRGPTLISSASYQGSAAYGGTPSDESVVAAIRDLNERGLKVMFYPFVMMDMAHGNGLNDPYGGDEQGAYPWRGRITASMAPGQPGSPDKTSEAADQMAAFVGTAAPGDFAIVGDTVVYAGPDEWCYRRLILHYAKLCKAAGGVDAFLIGSELRGLTTLRSDANTYPFVDRLTISPRTCARSSGRGEGLLRRRLERVFRTSPGRRLGRRLLPSRPALGARGHRLRRHRQLHAARRLARRQRPSRCGRVGLGRSAAYLRANIAGGEGFDWYYASGTHRDTQIRTPITDGAYGKPWVFRYKDLDGLVGEPALQPAGRRRGGKPDRVGAGGQADLVHRGRLPGGRQGRQPAQRLPRSEVVGERDPLLLDRGPRRPRAAPLLRGDARLLGRRPTRTMSPGSNPVSGVYGGRMVRPARTHLWTWDARPYPAFPALLDVWADGENWETGHWLTGRLGAAPASDLVIRILADYGITGVAVGELDGIVDGYLIDGIVSAREALEPLASLLMFEAFELGDTIRIAPRGRKTAAAFGDDDLVEETGRPLVQPPSGAGDGTAAGDRDRLYRPARRLPGDRGERAPAGHRKRPEHQDRDRRGDEPRRGERPRRCAAPGPLGRARDRSLRAAAAGAGARARRHLRPDRSRRDADADGDADRGRRGPPHRGADHRPGDPLADAGCAARPAAATDHAGLAPGGDVPRPAAACGHEPPYAPRIAAFAQPWPGAVAVALGTAEAGFLPRQAVERRR